MSGVTQVNFLKVRNNVDFRYVLPFTQADGTTPLDLSGSTFRMDVVPKVGSTTPILSLSLGSGLAFYTDGSDGKLMIDVDKAVMKVKTPGSYKYDIVMTTGTVDVTLAEGTIKIKAGVTDV